MLHIVQSKRALNECLLSYNTEHDAIVFIEDAIYALTTQYVNSTFSHVTASNNVVLSQCHIYALQSDVDARGMTGRLDSAVTLINHAQFVQLTVTHSNSLTWRE